MMQSIRTLIVQTVDLLEAEGHLARSVFVRLLAAVMWQLVGALLLLSGCIVACYGIYQLLREVLPPGAAVLLVGLLLMAIAGVFIWIAHGIFEGLDSLGGGDDDRS
jgi:hypothetical protein